MHCHLTRLVAATVLTLVVCPLAWAQEQVGSVAVSRPPSFFMHLLRSNGIIFGPLMFAVALWLFALIALLLIGLRRGRAVNWRLAARLTEAAEAGTVERLTELAREDRTHVGRAMVEGLRRLPNGIEEARRGIAKVVEQVRTTKEWSLRWLAGLAVLAPLLGFLGALLGAILIFMELGRPEGTPNPARLAEGLSHALVVPLEGIFLAVIAVFAYVVFKNRLSRVVQLTGAVAEDLLTRAHFRTRAGRVLSE